jgi:hypothetical protein
MNHDDCDLADIQGARECVEKYHETDNDEHMIDANCCVQSIVLRGNIFKNPFDNLTEQDLYLSFENGETQDDVKVLQQN